MIFNIRNIVAFIMIVIAWVVLTFFFIGCANTTYQTIPNAMCEDGQDYPSKYDMMDTPDGSRNPNAQINLLKLKY